METVSETRQTLVQLTDVWFRSGRKVLLSQITWRWRAGEHWGVLGANGAGKTTFLRLVRGEIWPAPDRGERLYQANGTMATSPIRFRENTGTVSCELLDQYKNQEWNLSGIQVVCTGFEDTPLLYHVPTSIELDRAQETLALLGGEALARRSLLSMSLGQARKVLIARALVRNPKTLFLDEVAAGLDSASRKTLLRVLDRLTERGTHILFAAHDRSEVPRPVTHVLALESGRVAWQGPISEFPSVIGGRLVRKPRLVSHGKKETKPRASSPPFLVRIKNADAMVNGTRILHGIDWTVRPGENWALFGKNGSGKTTLLKLIAGDLLPVWGGTVERFGKRKRETLWQIRGRVGFVSPDLQPDHLNELKGMDMVLSGFFGSVGLYDSPTPEQVDAACAWFQSLGVEHLRDQPVQALSYGQVRVLLILRAVVNAPALLLLDEPLSGLDSPSRRNVLDVVENLAALGTALMYVTHDESELPASITHVAVIDQGRLVFQGTRDEWQTHRGG